MNLQLIKEWVSLTAASISVLKGAKELLPESPQKTEAEKLIKQSETSFKAVEAQLAQELGFSVCHRCWPPEIMTYDAKNVLRCRNCNQPIAKGDAFGEFFNET